MLLFSLVSCLFTYAILRLQHLLPLNPQGLGAAQPAPGVQHRRQLHHQHQLAELRRRIHHVLSLADGRRWCIHNFVSAAVGIAIAAALVRGIARHSAKTLGNFWVDLVRVDLLPAAADLPRVRRVPRVARHDPELQALHQGQAAGADEDLRSRRRTTRARPIKGPDGKPVMEDRPSTSRPSCRARWPRRSPSRCSAPTAAATSTPTPRIRSRIPRRSPTSSRCSPSSPSAAG